MAKSTKTTLDKIDWDSIATELLATFNAANTLRTTAYGNDDRRHNAELAVQAALALAQVSAEARAVREEKERDNFTISKPKGQQA